MSGHIFIPLIAVAIVYIFQLEIDHDLLITSQTVMLRASVPKVFREITSLDVFPVMFPGIQEVLPQDARPWIKGKMFDGKIVFPILGSMQTKVKMTEFQKNSRLIFEGSSFILPKYIFQVEKTDKSNYAKMTIELYSKRRNYFFRLVVKPIMQILSHSQVRQRLFALKAILEE